MDHHRDHTAERFVRLALQQRLATKDDLNALKLAFSPDREGGGLFRDSRLLATYRDLVQAGEITEEPSFEQLLRRKKVRTASGVVPVAVITKPFGCPAHCVFCPTEKGVPKSYLSTEPAVRRAIRNEYDPRRQVDNRVRTLAQIGHSTDKIELLILGGTFTAYPLAYRREFVKACFDACNEGDSASLAAAQTRNERARHRVVGLSIETRPYQIDENVIRHLRELGVTRVELGVQSTYDDVLDLVRRGHSVDDVSASTQILKDAGFKVCYHMMPNLPGSDPERDVAMFRTLFSDPRFFPDMLKVYPCQVVEEAELYDWWRTGRYVPYNDRTLADLLVQIKLAVPPFVRINRIVREFPANDVLAGTQRSNMRQELQRRMAERGAKCRCIRCREIRGRSFRKGRPHLRVREYEASGGLEYFLSFEDDAETLYGLLRLRVPSQIANGQHHFIPELEGAAIIRELHTYGVSLAVGQEPGRATQHRGLGRRLVREAERLSAGMGLAKVAVIAGVGAREYFRKSGYRLEGTYMTRCISPDASC